MYEEIMSHPNWRRQVEVEEQMLNRGIERFRSRVTEAAQRKEGATVGGGLRLLRTVMEPLTHAIGEWIAEASSGRPGARQLAVRKVGDVPADKLAYLTARTVLNYTLPEINLQTVALAIGRSIEDELRLEAFAKEHKGLLKYIMDKLDKRGSNADWKRTVMVYEMNRHEEFDWEKWTGQDTLLVGMKMLDILMDATGLVRVFTRRNRTKTYKKIALSPDAVEWIKKFNDKAESLFPVFLPCVIPPKPWTGLRNGGYYSDHDRMKPMPLIKSRDKEHFKRLEEADLSLVYNALNSIQETPWRINTRVLDVVQDIWDRELDIGVLPSIKPIDLPPVPADIETNVESKKLWKRDASQVYEINQKAASKKLQVLRTLGIAQQFREETIYFPMQLDFRGRVYAMPVFLTPQGPDYSRGLLTFAKGKPIEDEQAAGWLAIHGANLYGEDKIGLVDRIAWVEENEDAILRAARDPLDDLWWTEADEPVSFLAFCFEWAEFQKEGWGFVSSLPVHVDGTCNGLQHFSAMLRDSVGGRATNLLPTNSGKPEDIYQRVADQTIEALKVIAEDPDTEPTEARTARQFIEWGIDRKITKRPVMVLPYGGTSHSCRRYVTDAIEEGIKDGKPDFWGQELTTATNFLATIVWRSIGEVVIAAHQAMGWLQTVAKEVSARKEPLEWTTPSGFVVRQAYPDVSSRRVKTYLNGSVIRVMLCEDEEGTINKRKQAQGISPNFVHSMDAAALMLTVDLANRNGVGCLSVIHDSFGSCAADMPMLGECIRHAFVDLYTEFDPLTDLHDQVSRTVAIPPVPDKGTLDITQVLESDFFFA